VFRHNVHGLTFLQRLLAGVDSFFFRGWFSAVRSSQSNGHQPQTVSGYILTFTLLDDANGGHRTTFPFTEQALHYKRLNLLVYLYPVEPVSSVPPEINYSWQRLELKGVTYPYCTEQRGKRLYPRSH